MSNPKYTINFNLETKILWKQSDNNELTSFGVLYVNRIKWFDADSTSLELLKIHLSPRVFFGNITIFYETGQVIG